LIWVVKREWGNPVCAFSDFGAATAFALLRRDDGYTLVPVPFDDDIATDDIVVAATRVYSEKADNDGPQD
jgi:hypothetical protein